MFVKRFFYPGALSGMLGAVAMALWFLAIDASQGQPFRTPAFLEAALLGRDTIVVTPGNIVLYSVIHLALFALAGVAVAWLLGRIRAVPGVLAGLIVGFVLYELVFFASVAVTGVDIVESLGWLEYLTGNLIAGVTLVGYLHMMGAAPEVSWWAIMRRQHILTEGIVAGLIGAAVVAVWFLIFDAVSGQPFFTPSALGSALFLGVTDLDAVSIHMGAVVGYSAVHLGAFAVMGVVASAVLTQAEEVPPLLARRRAPVRRLRGRLHGLHRARGRVPPRPSGLDVDRVRERAGRGRDGVLPVAQAPEAARRLRREPDGQDGLRGAYRPRTSCLRSTRPGSAPVSSPPSTTASPFTKTYSMPSFPPPGLMIVAWSCTPG